MKYFRKLYFTAITEPLLLSVQFHKKSCFATSGSIRYHYKYTYVQSHSTCVMTSFSRFSGSPLFLASFHCAIRSRLFTPSCRATDQRRRQKANHRRTSFSSPTNAPLSFCEQILDSRTPIFYFLSAEGLR